MLLKPAKDSVELLIFVSDIRKSLDFYQGTLGLEKTQELQKPSALRHQPRQADGPQARTSAGPIGLEKQLGIRFLSFVIRDLSGVCTVLREKGVEFTVPETRVLPDMRIAMVKDPDGNIVEFVEHA